MAFTTGDGRRPDPITMFTAGMKRVVNLDLDEISRGLAYLGNPDSGFLDMLGQTREERVEKMASMLRDASEADLEEMGQIFALAMARVAEEKGEAAGPEEPRGPSRSERPRRRRGQRSAEWRKERRRAS